MFAEAENTLYQLLDSGKIEYDEAVGFYQRLQQKRPEDLKRAGFRWRKSRKEWTSSTAVFPMRRWTDTSRFPASINLSIT